VVEMRVLYPIVRLSKMEAALEVGRTMEANLDDWRDLERWREVG
jgi:hypothetical protein